LCDLLRQEHTDGVTQKGSGLAFCGKRQDLTPSILTAVAATIGVDTERKSLEEIAPPLGADEVDEAPPARLRVVT
jgi:hypothetical protein